MFNDENSDFDVLVASDAIGMGLNLNISRIIFSTLKKFDGFETRDLTVSEIKQIAGKVFCCSCLLFPQHDSYGANTSKHWTSCLSVECNCVIRA